jgi:hypothetical protein
MDRRKYDDYDLDAPRRPRRRAKQKGGAALLLVAALVGVAVLLVGGVVGVVLVVKYAGRSPAPAAAVKPAEDGGAKPGDPDAKLAELSDRFIGKWEGESPERPSLKVHLDVTRDRTTMRVLDLRTNQWADVSPVSAWRPVRVEGDALVISQQLLEGGRGPHEYTIAFTSDDAMSKRSRESGKLVANFRRVKN